MQSPSGNNVLRIYQVDNFVFYYRNVFNYFSVLSKHPINLQPNYPLSRLNDFYRTEKYVVGPKHTYPERTNRFYWVFRSQRQSIIQSNLH